MINVTKTYLPPLNEYTEILKRAWDNAWLTNRGELVLELEQKLREYLDVKNILMTNNGTIPLQLALKLFGNGGEIITTPFSYVATTSSIVWENCKPVFVDIDSEYLTIDDRLIEQAITDKTKAILTTHVFGNPCDVEAIERIAMKYGLKVIYDGAHCFGVKYKGKSIFDYGDVSTCSFHATKLFHTGEGGALFCKEKEVYDKLYQMHNFGHNGPLDFHGLGVNAKISELQAAMGIANMPYIESILQKRLEIVERYDNTLNFEKVRRLKIREFTQWNYSYYPVISDSEEILLKILKKLNRKEIFPRRYFYPSLNKLPYVNYLSMPISENVAQRILCLPLYVGLTFTEIDEIGSIINE